ncbi:uncharacterized protein [Panulirus ornatus]|uniref:uncharacterized protein n=1 Tax=Panulirus ornatus TaxID=150431 RepID=UPI003A862F56
MSAFSYLFSGDSKDRLTTVEQPSDMPNMHQNIIDMDIPQDLLEVECSDLVYYTDRSNKDGDDESSSLITKLLTEVNAIDPSLSSSSDHVSRPLKATAIKYSPTVDLGDVDQTNDLASLNLTMTPQLRMGNPLSNGHCHYAIRDEQTIVPLPADVVGSVAKEEERKRKHEHDDPSSSSSQMPSGKKLKSLEVKPSVQDDEKERGRKKAQTAEEKRRKSVENSRRYRELQKKLKSDLEKELADVTHEKENLQRDLERLQWQVVEHTRMLQFYQQHYRIVKVLRLAVVLKSRC